MLSPTLSLIHISDIVIVNRTQRTAGQAAELSSVARAGGVDSIAEARLVVNATSVGMGTDDCPVDPTLLHAGHAVADIVYHPLDTALLRAARAAGAQPIDGLGMLVYQAIEQEALWTGHRPDPSLMRSAAERALATRRGAA